MCMFVSVVMKRIVECVVAVYDDYSLSLSLALLDSLSLNRDAKMCSFVSVVMAHIVACVDIM